MKTVLLPELGEGIEKAVVSTWLVSVGDQVKEGDDIVELVTDKAAFNVSAVCSGRIKQILAKQGEEIAIGQALAVIEPLNFS